MKLFTLTSIAVALSAVSQATLRPGLQHERAKRA